MAYPVTLKTWLSEKHRKKLKVARRWRKMRRLLSAACGSYRRPYTRPALDPDQRRAQLAISRRKRVPLSARKSSLDVVAAATGLADRVLAAARNTRLLTGPGHHAGHDSVSGTVSGDVHQHRTAGDGQREGD